MEKFDKNIYIDGSCLNIGTKDSMSGWSFIVVDNKQDKITEEQFGKIEKGVTNSAKAELEALYQALKWIKQNNTKEKYMIYTDHEVIVGSLEGECRRNGSRGYWEVIEPLCAELVGKFSICHVKSHIYDSEDRNHKYNNYADKLAKKGANSLILKAIKERSEQII